MCADKFLFEQVVYNLVNNAEKYCYRGTKIDMDCKLKRIEEDAPHVLTVTDYGLPLDPAEDYVFAPFRRGRNSDDVPGLGLGLYIVRVIVEHIHKGQIAVECDDRPISPYNVPLIKHYIERSFKGKEQGLVEKLRKELARLQRLKLYDSIVAYEPESECFPRYLPSDHALLNEIKKPTYKVTIKAEMPPLEIVEVTK